jgi:hypothetical protein
LADILETDDLLGFITAHCFEKWAWFHLRVEMRETDPNLVGQLK